MGDEVTAPAENIPSVNHSGPIYSPASRTSNADLPVLLAHYGIQAAAVHTNTDALAQDLDQGHKLIVGLNDKTIWNESGDRGVENHFVVVTGVDTRAGRNEQVSIATFDQAWDTSNKLAVVTR